MGRVLRARPFLRTEPGTENTSRELGIWNWNLEPTATVQLGGTKCRAPDTVREGLQRLVSLTQADELMVVSNIYDHAKRIRSYEIVADVQNSGARLSAQH